MKTFLLLFLTATLFLFNNPLTAGTIPKDAKEILTKTEKASGIDKLKLVKSFKVSAKVSMPAQNMNGTAETISTRNKIFSSVSIGPMKIVNAYDGKIAWGKDLMFGLRELKGQEATDVKIQTIDALINPSKYYDSITKGEDTDFDNKKCVTLIYKKKDEFDRTYYIDKSTYLPIGYAAKTKSPNGVMPITGYFKQYKTAKNGYKYPSETTIDMKIAKMSITVTDIEFDIKIDEKVFDKPKE